MQRQWISRSRTPIVQAAAATRTIHSFAAAQTHSASTSASLTRHHVQQRIQAAQTLCNAYVTPFHNLQQPLSPNPAVQPATAKSTDSTTNAAAALPFFPISLKDNFCLSGTLTTASSGMLRNFVPPYTATCVERLQQRAGATLTGKTNMDEFGMGSFTSNTFFKRVINPWSFRGCKTTADFRAVLADETRLLSAGGSSGGAAAALAMDSCVGSIGSDTGGSIRLPASYCGVLGLKPTYGRVSRFGLIAYASSLDTVSVMAKSTENIRKILTAIEGFDAKDSTSIEGLAVTSSSPTLPLAAAKPLSGLTIGIPREYDVAELAPEVRTAWFNMAERLRKEGGARVVDCSLPNTRHALPAYYILAPAEAMSNLARYDGVRYGYSPSKEEALAASAATGQAIKDLGPPVQSLQSYYTTNRGGFGEEVQRRILVGSFVLSSRAYSSHYVKAQQIRTAVTTDFNQLFAPPLQSNRDRIDLLLTPTSIGTSLSFEQIRREKSNPVASYLNDLFTIPCNLAGLPAMSIPAGLAQSNGLPIGLQLIGNYHTESTILDVAEWMQTRIAEDGVDFDLFKENDPILQAAIAELQDSPKSN